MQRGGGLHMYVRCRGWLHILVRGEGQYCTHTHTHPHPPLPPLTFTLKPYPPPHTHTRWDVAAACCRHRLEAHLSPVCSMALSHDATLLVTGCEDSTICAWDLCGRNGDKVRPCTSCALPET